MNLRIQALACIAAAALPFPQTQAADDPAGAVEFCLDGEFDVGVRLQSRRTGGSERYPNRFCVVTESGSDRAHFAIHGNSNADRTESFSVSYLPPESLRIVNRESPPDIEFSGAPTIDESLRHRRIDPYRLVEEIGLRDDWILESSGDGWHRVRYPGSAMHANLRIVDGKLQELRTHADMPLRGRVPVIWDWHWPGTAEPDEPPHEPALTMYVDGSVIFRAQASRRVLDAAEADAVWALSGGREPRAVPGEFWPARVNMQLETLADGIYRVSGVRTGFHHLVVDTAGGLVVADAPAGWVELPQIPPADLVPGLGVSGLSERFVDFLHRELPGRPVRAVALTHGHDDHAGGARAFAAAGAAVYAPAKIAGFLSQALNRDSMPADRLTAVGIPVEIIPVSDTLTLEDESNRVELVTIGENPHSDASLGIWAADRGFFFQSDLHIPNAESDEPGPGRAVTECWFAQWAVEHLPPETVVLNTHSLVQTPVSRLQRYLDHDACRS